MSELLESQSLKVDFYLDTVLARTTEAMGPQKCRIPTHWTFVLEAKLKTWRDEYRQWREENRHLKRRKVAENESATATGNQTPLFADPSAGISGTSSSNPLQQSNTSATDNPQQQPQQSSNTLPNFPLSTNNSTLYPQPWNTLDPSTTAMNTMNEFAPDMGDFTAAFQNGDLYLWNDMTADSFGGWVPQSGMYSGMEFNGQGF